MSEPMSTEAEAAIRADFQDLLRRVEHEADLRRAYYHAPVVADGMANCMHCGMPPKSHTIEPRGESALLVRVAKGVATLLAEVERLRAEVERLEDERHDYARRDFEGCSTYGSEDDNA